MSSYAKSLAREIKGNKRRRKVSSSALTVKANTRTEWEQMLVGHRVLPPDDLPAEITGLLRKLDQTLAEGRPPADALPRKVNPQR